jgi:hypothetical protein
MAAAWEIVWTLHLVAAGAMAGILWVVQLAIYPLFAAVGRDGFSSYHACYMRRISWVVGPLMLLEAGTAGWLVLNGYRPALFLIALGLLGLNWVSTAFVQVPLHRRLEMGFDATTHRRLVASNWVRTLAWTLRVALLISLSP